MQHPGDAMDTVTSFVSRVDQPGAITVATGFACLNSYRNVGPTPGLPISAYAALPVATRNACRDALRTVYDQLRTQQSAYELASSPAHYQNALQSARLVQQFEEMANLYSNPAQGSQARDRFMAENTQWLLNQAVPGTRMMLWAHNYHVSRLLGAMGNHLARAYGNGYVNLGFLFGRGSFNAVGSGGLRPWNAQLVPNNSVEAIFLATAQARLLFDTRRIASGGTAAQPLGEPILMRSIGAGFDPVRESNYFTTSLCPADYDLLMYVAQTSASTLLPFVR
jgi:erythromycin esterase